jgi:iron complex outermembrane receptor protein
VGAKFDLGSVMTSVAVFETTQPGLVSIAGTRTDLGYQRNRGLEINWTGEPIKGIRVLGGATFYDAELTETLNGADNGNAPVGVPDKQGNIDVEWDATFLTGLVLRGGVTYTDAQYLDNGNTLKIPSWTTVDLGARYTFQFDGKDVVLRGSVDNITGRDYWSSTTGGYLVMGDPRTASLSATLSF